MSSKLTLIAATGLALLLTAAPSQASSIAFVRDGDVWLSTADHSREHRVTTAGGFGQVTQADDGTLVAGSGPTLYRMDRNGRELNEPFTNGATPVAIDLSPDGSKVAYRAADSCGGRLCTQVHITDSAKQTDPMQNAYVEGVDPTWLSNERVIYASSNSCLYTTGVARGTGATWFCDEDRTADDLNYILYDAAITRAHDRLVTTRRPLGGGPWDMRFYTTTGEPPAEPQARCRQDFGNTEPKRPTWSPEGDALAWEQADGVHVQAAPDLTSCASNGGFTIAGATSPDWGPAEVPSAAAPPSPIVGPGGTAKCVVPKLKGKKLSAAKKALKKAHCTLGKVRTARSSNKPGTVIKQSVKAGQRRAAGAKVGVTVAKR